MIADLARFSLVYVATPYSLYPAGTETAFREASRYAASLIRAGVSVYCPIAHSHPIAEYGGLDRFDHKLWMPINNQMMERCDALAVIQMQGWSTSCGVGLEINAFADSGKPIFYLAPEALL